jgi:hypothetical protein
MDQSKQTDQVLIVVQHNRGLGRDDEPTLKQDVQFEDDGDEEEGSCAHKSI